MAAEQAANEQEMVAQLRNVRDYRFVPRAATLGPSDWSQEAARFVEVFRSGGIDWDFPKRAVARVRASKYRDQLILALDSWHQFLIACDLDTRVPVERYLELADPDPLRSRIRAAAAAKNVDALRDPLTHPGVRELPTLTLALLSEGCFRDERASALEAARAWQALCPDDNDANFELGRVLLCQESLTALHYKEASLFLTRAVAQHAGRRPATTSL